MQDSWLEVFLSYFKTCLSYRGVLPYKGPHPMRVPGGVYGCAMIAHKRDAARDGGRRCVTLQ